MSNGFGMIHDLASVEMKIRRVLMEARHEINCACQFATDYNELDRKKIDKLELMLVKAEGLIKEVIGD